MREKHSSLEEDWGVIMSILPERWEEQCKSLKAYQRKRAFKGPGDLLRTLLIHCAEGCSFRVTTALAGEGGIATLSDVALNRRLRLASDWMQWLATGVTEKWLRPERFQSYDGPLRVKVADASTVQEPGSKGTSWRLHYSLELSSLRCNEIKITGSEGAESFKQFEVQPGDLWLGDRAYAQRSGIHHVVSQGGDVLVRVGWNSMVLNDEEGTRFDLLGHLRMLKLHHVGDWPVFVPYGEHQIVGRICAMRKSAAVTARERKRILKECSRKGRKPRPETLEAAQYTFVFTTLDQSIPTETILAIYRTRWQIELTFKRLKSLLKIGHLHNRTPESAKAWLYGKLLAACLIEALVVVSERFFPWGYPIVPTTQDMAQYLEGDRRDVPFFPTGPKPRQQSAPAT